MSTQLAPSSVPFDREAEQAVLGSIIMYNDNLSEVANYLKSTSFFTPAHQKIFQCMLDLSLEQQPIDEVTLGGRLKTQNILEDCGGYAYLSELVDCVPNSSSVNYYVKIVQEQSLLRELIITTTDIAQKSRGPEGKVEELIAEAESKINEIAFRSTEKQYSHIREVIVANLEQLEKLSENDEEITGVPTGFMDLDKITSGFQKSDLVIIAARPAMGKTAFSLNLAQYAASQPQVQGAVIIFSLEMSKEQLGVRLLTSRAKVDSQTVRTGNLNQDDWDRLALATEELAQMPIYLNDSSQLSILEMISICKQLYKEHDHGVSLIMVDYLQLMKGSKNAQSREQEISEISRGLKGLAKELSVPVLALSQLNRSLENRSDKRPVMADLRESGAIEQDADMIIFIYRDEVYHEDSKDRGTAEIIIGKHRNGSLGTVRLAFIGKYTKFANYSPREEANSPAPIPA